MKFKTNTINNVLAKVNEFIADLENGKIELTKEAKELVIYSTTKGRFGKTSKKVKGKFLNYIGWAISDYKSATNLVMKWEYAKECLRYIEWAYSWGIVGEKAIIKRVKALEKENKELKEVKDKLEQTVIELQNKIEDQRKLISKFGVIEVGSVDDEEFEE